MLGEIYCITNIITKKQYVGITRYCFRVRYNYRDDWWNAPSVNIKLKNSVKKYGPDAFIVEIVEKCKIEDLEAKEIFYIKTLNTLHPNGFNLTSGGNYKYTVSEESKLKNRLAHIGKPAWNKGKKLTQEHVNKSKNTMLQKYKNGDLTAWNKGKKTGRPSEQAVLNSAKAHMKPVICTLNGIFVKQYDSVKDTEIDGFRPCQVSLVCNGKGKSHKGHVFCFLNKLG